MEWTYHQAQSIDCLDVTCSSVCVLCCGRTHRCVTIVDLTVVLRVDV